MATLSLIASNWKYFWKLFTLIKAGATELQVSKALNDIEEAWKDHEKTKDGSQKAASDLNDVFRN